MFLVGLVNQLDCSFFLGYHVRFFTLGLMVTTQFSCGSIYSVHN